MSETTFENAKEGERVYSPLFKSENTDDKTNLTIISIFLNDYKIEVKPDIVARYHTTTTFGFDGSWIEDGGQCLFWENPIHEIPVRPKRKVIKKGYFVIQPRKQNDRQQGCIGLIPTELHDSPQRLEGALGYDGRQLASIEFEVEE